MSFIILFKDPIIFDLIIYSYWRLYKWTFFKSFSKSKSSNLGMGVDEKAQKYYIRMYQVPGTT